MKVLKYEEGQVSLEGEGRGGGWGMGIGGWGVVFINVLFLL